MYSKHRLEALSDAIFAIVMTLLVLELKVPTDVVHGHLWEALRVDGEDWIAFFITFLVSARYWIHQHDVFKLTDNYSHHAVVLTFIFLGFVTILPFSSTLVGRHASEPLALVLYCGNQTAIGIALIAKLEFLRHRDHIPKSAEMTRLRLRLYTITLTMATAAAFANIPQRLYLLIVPAVSITVSRIIEIRHKRTKAQRTEH